MPSKPKEKNYRSKTAKNIPLVDENGFFSAYPKSLNGVPLEYQAAVYAKQLRERQTEKRNQRKINRKKLRSELHLLKEKLHLAQSEAARIELIKEIASKEKAIQKAPKAKRGWSPVLSGSFESGKQR